MTVEMPRTSLTHNSRSVATLFPAQPITVEYVWFHSRFFPIAPRLIGLCESFLWEPDHVHLSFLRSAVQASKDQALPTA